MTCYGKTRNLRCVTVDSIPLRSLLLALFFVLGVLAAYAASGRCAGASGEELRQYVDECVHASTGRALTGETAAQTAFCYFRAPALAFLLGFASIGIFVLPLLLAAQGFLLSFSLFSFAAAAGRDGFMLLPALFAVRMLFVLPCTFLLGAAALEKAYALALLSLGNGKRTRPVAYGTPYWYRFAVCCVCLSLGCALELWLVPALLTRLPF